MLFGTGRRANSAPLARRVAAAAPARVPDHLRVYAIGDIHGRLDLLRTLWRQIEDDARRAPEADKLVVCLGDYVDRGPDTRGVLDWLTAALPAGWRRVCLKGNHEDLLLRFLETPARTGQHWLWNGGEATLRSYGVVPALDLAGLHEQFQAALPAAHLAFLRGLPLRHEEGDYLFVHAGVRPGLPLDAQDEADLIWIRDEFLDCAEPFGKVVVHGHTPVRTAQLKANRIGIDTGAYASGRLSCLVLAGSERRILHT